MIKLAYLILLTCYILTDDTIYYDDGKTITKTNSICKDWQIKRLLCVWHNSLYLIYEGHDGLIYANTTLCTKVNHINYISQIIKYSETEAILYGGISNINYVIVEYPHPIADIRHNNVLLANGDVYYYCVTSEKVHILHNVVKILPNIHIKYDGIYHYIDENNICTLLARAECNSIYHYTYKSTKLNVFGDYINFADIKQILRNQYVVMDNGDLYVTTNGVVSYISSGVDSIEWDCKTSTIIINYQCDSNKSHIIGTTYFSANGDTIENVLHIFGKCEIIRTFNKNARS